jgi:hypothetical protein
MKRTALMALIAGLSLAGCGYVSTGTSHITTYTPTDTAQTTRTESPPNPVVPPKPKAQPAATAGQRNALESAQSYLRMGGFSEQGLIDQLTSSAGEGFSQADARYAVNHAGADWNEQAVQKAQSYLDMGGFSRPSLMEQLTSSAGEGFTQAQAQYAVDKVYR